MRFVFNQPAQGAVDIPQRFLLNGGQPRNIHHQKQKNDFPAVALIASSTGFQEFFGYSAIVINDLIVACQLNQLGCLFPAGKVAFILDAQKRAFPFADAFMRYALEQNTPISSWFDLFDLAFKPGLGILFTHPVLIGRTEIPNDQAIQIRTIHIRVLGALQVNFAQPFQLIMAFDEQKENIIRIIMDQLEGMPEHRRKSIQGIPRVFQEFLDEQQQVVHGIHSGGHAAHSAAMASDKISTKHRAASDTLGMCLQQVKIIQGIVPGLIDDKLPVFIGVGQFLQKGRHPFPDAEVLRHRLMKCIVLGIDADIDMVISDVDFKCFGFDGQDMPPQ